MQLELTHNERLLLILGLGAYALAPAPVVLVYGSEPQADPHQLAAKLIDAGNGSLPAEMPELQVSGSSGVTQPHPNNASASAMTSAPLPENKTPITWWAKGCPGGLSDPTRPEIESISVKPLKIEPKPTAEGTARLMVTWQNQGKGFSRASVWDEQLFSKVKDREGKPTTFFVTRKGQWVNIVGVRY